MGGSANFLIRVDLMGISKYIYIYLHDLEKLFLWAARLYNIYMAMKKFKSTKYALLTISNFGGVG